MRATRALLVAGGCTAIVGAGWVASPKELPSLDLVAPSSPTPAAEAEATPTASASTAPSPEPAATASCVPTDNDPDEDDVDRDDEDDCVLVTPSPTATVAASPEATADAGADAGAQEPATATYDGPVVSNVRGDYQARITVEGGVVTDVQAVVAGTREGDSIEINARAIPELRDKVLAAQTWDVAAVSGASFTSPAFIESLEGAFAQAGL